MLNCFLVLYNHPIGVLLALLAIGVCIVALLRPFTNRSRIGILSFALILLISSVFLFWETPGLKNKDALPTTAWHIDTMGNVLEEEAVFRYQPSVYTIVQEINQIVDAIDSIQHWQKVQLHTVDYSSESGEVFFCYDKENKLRRIDYTAYGEMGKEILRYYFQGDSLRYVYDAQTQYTRPIYYDSSVAAQNGDTVVFSPLQADSIETSHYFHRGRLLAYADNTDCGYPHWTERIPDEEKRILGLLNRLQQLKK